MFVRAFFGLCLWFVVPKRPTASCSKTVVTSWLTFLLFHHFSNHFLAYKIVEEKGLSTTVEACDCQGECGYGPNLLVDGKLFNNVRGRDAVLQALNIQDDDDD